MKKEGSKFLFWVWGKIIFFRIIYLINCSYHDNCSLALRGNATFGAGRLRRPFGKPPLSAAFLHKEKKIGALLAAVKAEKKIGALSAPQMVLRLPQGPEDSEYLLSF